MDKETIERLSDYFESWELCELLGLKTSDIIEAFPEDVEHALDDLEEIIGVGEKERDDGETTSSV